MNKDKLKQQFEEAVDYMNQFTAPLPADILLSLYAYYRIAKEDYSNPGSRTPLINAFKANALIQSQNISKSKAMKQYVRIVHEVVQKDFGEQ